MRADKVLLAIIAKEGLTDSEVSSRIGKSPRYLDSIRYRHAMPKTDTMATVCDAIGYDLLVRSRDDGYEIEIDPKTT